MRVRVRVRACVCVRVAVEVHPLYPQEELRAYCEREGIVLQAYAALGGQDGSKAKWQALGGHVMEAAPVLAAAGARAQSSLACGALIRGCSLGHIEIHCKTNRKLRILALDTTDDGPLQGAAAQLYAGGRHPLSV